MIKIAICDDDALSLQSIKEAVSNWAFEYNIQVTIEGFNNGDQLLDHCLREHTDILLLDIMMPLLNGMDTAHEIRDYDQHVQIIFFTSSPEFAIESYDVKASGYLLKPVSYEKLCTVLNDCIWSVNVKPDSITLHTVSGYQNLYLHQIECVEAQNKKMVFTLSDGSTLKAFGTLSSYEETLNCDRGFFKCHRSYLVYIPAVDYFTASEILTKSGCRVPIARGRGKNFEEFYFSYMFKEV